jgi:hypothetical protein
MRRSVALPLPIDGRNSQCGAVVHGAVPGFCLGRYGELRDTALRAATSEGQARHESGPAGIQQTPNHALFLVMTYYAHF